MDGLVKSSGWDCNDLPGRGTGLAGNGFHPYSGLRWKWCWGLIQTRETSQVVPDKANIGEQADLHMDVLMSREAMDGREQQVSI